MQKCSLVPGLPPQLSSLAVRITMRSVIRTALSTASDDSCVRGGLDGYKATGHAREKPNQKFSALSDAAGPEKQGIYLPRPYMNQLREIVMKWTESPILCNFLWLETTILLHACQQVHALQTSVTLGMTLPFNFRPFPETSYKTMSTQSTAELLSN